MEALKKKPVVQCFVEIVEWALTSVIAVNLQSQVHVQVGYCIPENSYNDTTTYTCTHFREILTNYPKHPY